MNEIDIKKAYEKELEIYESMFKITREQERSIQSKDLKKLSQLICQKAKMMEKIEKIEKSLVPFKEKWKNCKDEFALKEEISTLMRKIASLLEEVLSWEKKNELLLKNHLSTTAIELKNIQTGKTLKMAYKRGDEERSRFMNQKG